MQCKLRMAIIGERAVVLGKKKNLQADLEENMQMAQDSKEKDYTNMEDVWASTRNTCVCVGGVD